MCTVVFIPNHGKYWIASIRDEHPKRVKANLPAIQLTQKMKFMAPIDPQGGGTWVGLNEGGSAIVLLNGGFKNHLKKAAYAKSRGLIVSDLLSVNDPIEYWLHLGLNEIEPFTLIVWHQQQLMNLVWDGNNKHQIKMDAIKAHIWSSSTLYNDAEKKKRSSTFEKWISSPSEKSKDAILDFFMDSKCESGPIFIRNTPKIVTHSYTCIEIVDQGKNNIFYQDLIAEEQL
jgi:uncharacterized protein with NRDE domain